MRKMIVWLILLVHIQFVSLGEESALFPAMGENDLWGYIDQTGCFVIAPQYMEASSFLLDYAAVSCCEGEWGIINSRGKLVLPMQYLIDPVESTGIFLITANESPQEIARERKAGFFNGRTGAFSGLCWQEVLPVWQEVRLIPVMDENGLYGFADIETGEEKIPCQFEQAECFDKGWAAVLSAEGEDSEWALINEQGKMLFAPEGYSFDLPYGSRMSDGLVSVYNDEYVSYINTEGKIILNTDCETGYPFYDGFAVVNYDQYMNRNGSILEGVSARPEENGGYEFVDGLTSVFYHEKPAAMNTAGEIAFVLEEEHVFWLWNFMENGLAWYMEWQTDQGNTWYEQRYYGLVDRQGNVITDGIWICTEEEGSPFSEGLAAVKPMKGPNLYGYINEQGELVIPPIYEEAQPFKNGLAYVKTESRWGYIDASGREIYFWTQPDETEE